jgi:hypothetical protein
MLEAGKHHLGQDNSEADCRHRQYGEQNDKKPRLDRQLSILYRARKALSAPDSSLASINLPSQAFISVRRLRNR